MSYLRNNKGQVDGFLPVYLLPPRELTCYVNYVPYPVEEFESIKVLAKAIHGSVLLALHKPTNTQVAIKKLNNTSFSNITNHLLEHPIKEIGALKFLTDFCNGEFINQLLEIYRDENYTYIVLEYAKKGELFNIIKTREYLIETEAKVVVHQIIRSIKSLHENAICHRDISLENILIHENGSVRLSDFGQTTAVYKLNGKPQLFNGIAGKTSYRAPEMLKDDAYQGFPADIFALGVLLFILLVGSPPWKSPDPNDSRYMLVQDKGCHSLLKRWKRTDRASKVACRLIDWMVRNNPEERPNIQQVLNHEWFHEEGFRAVSWRKAKVLKPFYTEYNFFEEVLKEEDYSGEESKQQSAVNEQLPKKSIETRKTNTTCTNLFSTTDSDMKLNFEISLQEYQKSLDREDSTEGLFGNLVLNHRTSPVRTVSRNTSQTNGNATDEEATAEVGDEYPIDKCRDTSQMSYPPAVRNRSHTFNIITVRFTPKRK